MLKKMESIYKKIIERIGSSICEVFDEKMAHILANPLIWAAFEDSVEDQRLLPGSLKKEILEMFRKEGLNTEVNSVERIGIQPMGNGADMCFLELRDVNNGSERLTSGQRTPSGQDTTLMMYQFTVLRRSEEVNTSISADLARLRADMNGKFTIMVTSVKLIVLQLAKRRLKNAEAPKEAIMARSATLSKGPKDLYSLWLEFQFGTGGRKPAKF